MKQIRNSFGFYLRTNYERRALESQIVGTKKTKVIESAQPKQDTSS